MTKPATPYYLIDENKLLGNLKIIQQVREASGAKSVLALKCFSSWCVFDLMRQYLDGTTSSSLFEARLGHEKFGKEVHAYSVAFSASDIKEIREFASKIIFNSISQLTQYHGDVSGLKPGLRINPGISYSHYDLADPARKYSRLGISNRSEIEKISSLLSGLMFHFNCENDDFYQLSAAIDRIGIDYGFLLEKMEWVSLGGGIAFTKHGYPVDQFCAKLKSFSEKFGVQVYLEPGEATITHCAELVTTVLDVIHNEIAIAIIDASLEAHLLDHLIYRTTPKLISPEPGKHHMMIAGRTCLAGDVFGEYDLDARLEIGSEVRIADAAGYTMVKKNWFNGISMPSIVVRRLDGTVEIIREFGYEDFKRSLS
ncbi:MAG: carboxynorspermidine decarboxylase [Candidatus Competibacter sp.]|nr:carboxynorspermidine decarboxylase [Candidatus Competibacter sp.]MDG4606957.1 carboxynorspermidine decarboxylase [Candidatus Contendobacter sp.]HRD49560.1 carboxynorspermidine decarboxylase [Candidatus Contendobacter sp.]